ncbi:hypothetical protein [Siccirubricoccus sp. G192]|uniref:hypothetical protein n=1 Tax=Siccirubricoccus sp. G192 TaxID=2849651 RepID=UPI001C2BF9FD|nr:hypothetical protein [Siccirubricoccus sp. G192]MBV1800125.1 hypothetical protein [Siccirubricoccus sp. G192]
MPNRPPRSNMPAFLAGCAVIPLLAACGYQPPSRSVASTPIGSTATSPPWLSPQGYGPGGINRNYYIGADPNFPEGTTGSRGGGGGAGGRMR